MSPTYNPGDKLIVLKHYPIQFVKYGDIVISDFRKVPGLRHPHIPLTIKRVIGLPNSSLDISLIDHNDLVINVDVHPAKAEHQITIPANHYFLGADSDRSTLKWGPIPSEALFGLVIFKL